MKKILLITISILLLGATFAFAASPAIFYSDLTSGPNAGGQNNKGVFVTISGKNFGTTKGTSYVLVGGGQADNYPVWSDTKITFQLGANAVTGNITVTTSSGISNGIPFTVRTGNIYFVDAINGLDTNDGSYAHPWKTLLKVENSLTAGSTYYFRAGTWLNQMISLSGSAPNGISGNEIALVAYPGETARWESSYNFDWGYSRDYYVIAGFQFYSTGHSTQIRGNYNRFINNDCEGLKTHDYAIINPMECNYAKIYGNTLRGATSGNKLDHPLYIGYGADNVDFGWNHIYDNDVAEGPAISTNQDGAGTNPAYKFENNLIHDNIIDCRNSSVGLRAIGFIAQYAGSSAKVYNNIVISGGGNQAPYTMYQISGSVDYYNNTLYNCSGDYVLDIGDDPGSGNYVETVNVKNNIFYVSSPCAYIHTSGVGTIIIDHNSYYGYGNGPPADTHAVNADPKFVTLGTDFHLQSTSPAVDAGYNTSSVVAKDKDGLTRPQGSAFDIGAYEYGSGTPPADSTAPSIPANLSATATSSTQINLTWNASTDNVGVTGYNIYRNSTQVATSSTNSYSDTGLTSSTTYTYNVAAYDAAGNTSAQSSSASATTQAASDTTAPAAISNLSATAVSSSQITLTWTAPGDDGSTSTASSYIIRYSTSAITTDVQYNAATDVIGEPTPTAAGTSQSMTVSGLNGKTKYYFAMKTLDEVPNISNLSNCANATTADNPPVLAAIGNKSVNENTNLNFTISATDADNDTLTYTTSSLPSGATFSNRTFNWTPDYTQSGNYSVTFTVSDGSLTDSETITISVGNVNRPPVLAAIGNKTVNENSALTFTVSATDPDEDSLVYSATNLPSGASFNTSTQTFSWTPDYTQAGTYQVTFSVRDSSLTDSQAITITVVNVNRPPVLALIGNKSVTVVSNLSFTISATDPDNDTLTYSVNTLPSGAAFDATAKSFSWTPATGQAGTYNVTFTVSDGSLTDSETITITVNNVVVPPPTPDISITASATPTSGTAPLAATFNASATSKNGSIVKYE